MRVLLDEGTPSPLRGFLLGHHVETVQELGWSSASDKQLLQQAEGVYDLFITTDKNLPYQQNLTKIKLAILVLPTPSWPKLMRHAGEIAAELDRIRPGELRQWTLPPTV